MHYRRDIVAPMSTPKPTRQPQKSVESNLADQPKQKGPMSLRFTPQLENRLEHCAEKLHMKKHTLAQEAIAAAVEAIEKNGYRLVVPIEFKVTHIPKKDVEDPPKTENEDLSDN